jgi:predicted lysophospholipase L1 biosynthesis ABC-type transport system permease subunit
MAISTILALLLGLVTAFFAAVYCFKPDMIVRQVNETARRTPKLLHFALPIQPREGRITVRQVRSTGLGLFLLSAWFLLVAILAILGHH